MSAISIDVGTTVIKAVGYDDNGREAIVARQATTVSRPRSGWAEQDMDDVWEAVAQTVGEVASRLGPATVAHVAVTAQGDGAWLVDAGGGPTGPAVLWNDGRAAAHVQAWTRSGVLQEAFALNGSLTSSGLPNAVLAWMHEHDPARLERSATVLTCGAWVFQRLTGQVGVDQSDASAPFMDIAERRYSIELLRLYGMEWAERLLPQVRSDDQRVAGLHGLAAERLGLPLGTPVVLAPYDIASTGLGVGAVEPGQASSILGTTLCTQVVTDQVRTDGPAAGLTVALGADDRWLRAFPTLAGTEVVQWACGLLGLTDPARLTELAAGSDVGAAGLMLLPYLSPAGERAPFLDPQARGALLGLSLEHRREDVARAVLEGLSLVVQDCLVASGARPTELRVCGGGAGSPLWLQLIADTTGLPVSRSVDTEVGARGAFLTASVATGTAPDLASAVARHVVISDRYAPDTGRAAQYAALYDDFTAVRADTSHTWPRLADARRRAADRPSAAAGTAGAPAGPGTPVVL